MSPFRQNEDAADDAPSYFTVLRLALPRTSIRDIAYQETVIPKGTVFFLNAWACNMGTSQLGCLQLNARFNNTAIQTRMYGRTPTNSDQSAGWSSPMRLSSPTAWVIACVRARCWPTASCI